MYPSTLPEIPKIVRWANKHMDLVNGLIFIAFRAAPQDGTFDYYANGQRIDSVEVSYTSEDDTEIHTTSTDIYNVIKETQPRYETSGYLGGSQTHDAIKWLLNVQIGDSDEVYGSLGPKAMELIQSGHHFFYNTYMAYTHIRHFPKVGFLLGLFDRSVRQAHKRYWKAILRHPGKFFKPLNIQSIGIVQAPDILVDGRQDMCDSCPDMTVWDGRLVHSCRMDEWRLYNTYMVAQPHVEIAEAASGNGHTASVTADK